MHGEQIFLAVVGDTQWATFCQAFGFADWQQDIRLTTNNDRVRARGWLIPQMRERMAQHTAAELAAVFEKNGLPFAPITDPQHLFDDPHLLQTGGLAPMTLPDGRQTTVPLLPLTLDGARPGVRLNPPRLGEHGAELLHSLGYSEDEIADMQQDGVLNLSP
jgi:crotonobetainyl-CoA:carnitine CoA-transferase CaiB-like acyl-CoA transferase